MLDQMIDTWACRHMRLIIQIWITCTLKRALSQVTVFSIQIQQVKSNIKVGQHLFIILLWKISKKKKKRKITLFKLLPLYKKDKMLYFFLITQNLSFDLPSSAFHLNVAILFFLTELLKKCINVTSLGTRRGTTYIRMEVKVFRTHCIWQVICSFNPS